MKNYLLVLLLEHKGKILSTSTESDDKSKAVETGVNKFSPQRLSQSMSLEQQVCVGTTLAVDYIPVQKQGPARQGLRLSS